MTSVHDKEKPIRVLMAKVGLDSHERASRLITNFLRDAGIEVIYLGLFQTPQSVVAAAVQEDVDIIAISSLAGEEMIYMPELMQLVKAQCPRVRVILGGTIPGVEIPLLKDMGVSEVFTAGSSAESAVHHIKEIVPPKSSAWL